MCLNGHKKTGDAHTKHPLLYALNQSIFYGRDREKQGPDRERVGNIMG